MKKHYDYCKQFIRKDGVLMNPIISNRLNLFAQELQYVLSPVALQDIAKQVGFVQRSSKYQAKEHIALCVWLSQEIASTSLTQLCSQLGVQPRYV